MIPAHILFEGAQRARLAAGVVGFSLGLPEDAILARNRSPDAASARHVVMYLLVTAFGMTLRRVAAALDRDPTLVAYAVRRIEERCEDSRFESWLRGLEAWLRSAPPQNITRRAP